MSEYYASISGRTGCGPGWDRVIFPLIDEAKRRGLAINQIKEKFGGLRFYYAPYDDDFEALVNEAEDVCSRTCEKCGKPGTLRPGGWVKTLCDECADARKEREGRGRRD